MLFPWFLYLLFIPPLVYIAVIDWRERRIPNKIILPLALAAFLAALSYGHPFKSLLGGVAGLIITLIPILIVGQDQLGIGDVKYALFLGTALGWFGVMLAILTGSILAGLYFLWGKIRLDFDRSTTIPLAPFLGGGYLIALAGYYFILY